MTDNPTKSEQPFKPCENTVVLTDAGIPFALRDTQASHLPDTVAAGISKWVREGSTNIVLVILGEDVPLAERALAFAAKEYIDENNKLPCFIYTLGTLADILLRPERYAEDENDNAPRYTSEYRQKKLRRSLLLINWLSEDADAYKVAGLTNLSITTFMRERLRSGKRTAITIPDWTSLQKWYGAVFEHQIMSVSETINLPIKKAGSADNGDKTTQARPRGNPSKDRGNRVHSKAIDKFIDQQPL